MYFTSINYPLLSFTFYNWHLMGKSSVWLGVRGLWYQVWSFSTCSESETSRFASRAWGNSLFSAAWQNPFANAHRLAGSSILVCTTLSLSLQRPGAFVVPDSSGSDVTCETYLWCQGKAWTDSLVSLCPYSYCWPSGPVLEKPKILVTNLTCRGQVLLLLQRAAPGSGKVLTRRRWWEE